jgi:hypothetical protein
VIGVAVGWALKRRADTLVCSLVAVGAIVVWLNTRNPYFLLPFAGVLVGLFHRREEYVSVFGQK